MPESYPAATPTGEPVPGPGLPVARCYRHPLRETGVRCVRCDRPICPECMRPASVGFQCPDDVRLGRATQREPRTVVGARAVHRHAYPLVTWTIVALNVAVYLATGLTSVRGINDPSASSLFRQWVMLPQAVASNDQFYRLITGAFLHENLLHIAMNMLALLLVGPYLERLLGVWRFAAVYLLSALGGSVAVYLLGAHYTAVAGASGAIFGLFAAALLLVRELGFDLRALIGTIVLNMVLTFSIPGISRYGHLGGFLVGGLAALAIAGLPQRRRMLPLRVQLAGLGGILAVLAAVVVLRTAAL